MNPLRLLAKYPLTWAPWRPYRALEPSSVARPGERYSTLVARWRGLCREVGSPSLDETYVKPAVVEFLRHFAIETGELEDLYRLYPDSKARAVAHGLQVLTSADQKPARGVPVLTAPGLVAVVEDQYASIEAARDAGLGSRPLTESNVRSWHADVVRAQPSLPHPLVPGVKISPPAAGVYKTSSNLSVLARARPYRTCPHKRVPEALRALYEQVEVLVRSRVETTACAAWVHTAFGHLHPFADGNTRTARLLTAYVFCRRDEHPPVFLSRDAKPYLRARRDAEAGRLEPLRGLLERWAVASLGTACGTIDRAPEIVEPDVDVGVRIACDALERARDTAGTDDGVRLASQASDWQPKSPANVPHPPPKSQENDPWD